MEAFSFSIIVLVVLYVAVFVLIELLKFEFWLIDKLAEFLNGEKCE